MAKKSKKVSVKSSIHVLPKLDSREVDLRIASSPYTSTYIKVFFGADATAMKLPAALLQKCSNLPPGNIVVENSLHLTHVPEEVGHVLVHHLFTGTFQCLAPGGSTQQERQITELMTCIRAYAVAWDYELNSLKEQAQSEIERLGVCLPLAPFLAALDEIYPHPSKDDIWLGGYLKDRMKALFAGRETVRSTESLHTEPKSSIATLVVDNALRLHEEELELVNRSNEYEPASSEDMPQHVYKHGFVRQEILPESQTAANLERDDTTLQPAPVHGHAVPDSPRRESVLELSHDNKHAQQECRSDLEPAGGSVPIDHAALLIAYEEFSIEPSMLEPSWQNKTAFVPGSETDSSSPVFTPPSSTTSRISTDSVKLRCLETEARHKQEAPRAAKKSSTLKMKKTKRSKLQEGEAVQDLEDLDVICGSMSQHLKIGGEWKDCEFCRNLVDRLAAGL